MNTDRPYSAVLKFGGAVLADGRAVRRACALVADWGGDRPIVVVSALEGVTQELERLACAAAGKTDDLRALRIRHRSVLSQLDLDAELCDRLLAELSAVLGAIRAAGRAGDHHLDGVLSFGERMSARIVAAHLRHCRVDATPVDAFDLGLRSDSNHGRARPLPGSDANVRAALEGIPGLPVVTGFVSADASGNLTTLGRNGSDLTAALVGAAVGVREVQFWKTVGGVMTADPTVVAGARSIPRLTYAQAAEYARAGARVIHPDTLEPLCAADLPARVLDVRDPHGPSTVITAGAAPPGPVGVASARDPARVTVPGATAERVRRTLEASGVAVLEERERGDEHCPHFVVQETELVRAASVLHDALLERLPETEEAGLA